MQQRDKIKISILVGVDYCSFRFSNLCFAFFLRLLGIKNLLEFDFFWRAVLFFRLGVAWGASVAFQNTHLRFADFSRGMESLVCKISFGFCMYLK